MNISEVNINEFDALAIPGGFEETGFYEDAYDEDFLNLIREFNKAGKIIASICVGALPIGKSGVLQGRNAFDVAFTLLELLTSKENCINVKHLMGF